MYGVILYYATSVFDYYVNQVSCSRPEALYFWGYYFFMNFIWAVVPSCKSYSAGCDPVLSNQAFLVLVYRSTIATLNAFEALTLAYPSGGGAVARDKLHKNK